MNRINFLKALGLGLGVVTSDISLIVPKEEIINHFPTVFVKSSFPATFDAASELTRLMSEYISEEIDREMLEMLQTNYQL